MLSNLLISEQKMKQMGWNLVLFDSKPVLFPLPQGGEGRSSLKSDQERA